ncbi:MAG: formylglycine-generating enzyme family protein, partial [bacterium]|nr:formylglycine-generating enzyme family protein [bacterium]
MQLLTTRASVERLVYPLLIWLCWVLSIVTAESANPVVSNMVARQINGGRQVEITYDVADADGDTLWVSVQVSDDGGVTYSVPARTFKGDIGRMVPGRGKQVIWYVESDVDRAARGRFEVKVVVSDLRPEMIVNTSAGTVHEMVLVPEGSFQMGAEDGENFERPVHTVFLDAYRIDKFEVTNAQFVAFLNTIGRNTDQSGNRMLDLVDNDVQVRPSDSRFELKSPAFALRPVAEVSWYGARAYCEWIKGRLPTEAEWERAARGI